LRVRGGTNNRQSCLTTGENAELSNKEVGGEERKLGKRDEIGQPKKSEGREEG